MEKTEAARFKQRRSRTSHWSGRRMSVPLMQDLGGHQVVCAAAQFQRYIAPLHRRATILAICVDSIAK